MLSLSNITVLTSYCRSESFMEVILNLGGGNACAGESCFEA